MVTIINNMKEGHMKNKYINFSYKTKGSNPIVYSKCRKMY